MKVELKKLSLHNFKGIKEKVVEFDHLTNISGENGTGKTTIFDAFVWLLFGKNSADQKDFNIKTLDKHNNTLSKVEHEVRGELVVDGSPVELRRIFKEKWVKKRGEQDAEFTGHETLFYHNGVPLQAAEFKQKIDAIANESIFKLVTNAWAFNSLKWQERRSVLIELAGKISDVDVLDKIAAPQNKSEILNLTFILNSHKSLAEYKREITARKKKLSDDLKQIPARIDEVHGGMPEMLDYNAILHSIDEMNQSLVRIDEAIADKSKASGEVNKLQLAHQGKVNSVKSEISQLEHQIKFDHQTARNSEQLSFRNLQNKIENINQDITSKTSLLNSRKKRIEEMDADVKELRSKWEKLSISTLVFRDDEFCCPTCKREFEADVQEEKKNELKSNFDIAKASQLSAISLNGKALNKAVVEYKEMTENISHNIEGLQVELATLTTELNVLIEKPKEEQGLESIIANNAQHQQLVTKLSVLEAEKPGSEVLDISGFTNQKLTIHTEMDALKKQLATKEQIEKSTARIKELNAEERNFSQQIADMERSEFLIDDFNRAKIDMVENRINSKFSMVKFKMYDKQINGGEVEACETLINGVPFSDANNASKINAGIDVINTLCAHYNIYAPIFCDNAESINEILPTESQLIRLIVTKDPILKVA